MFASGDDYVRVQLKFFRSSCLVIGVFIYAFVSFAVRRTNLLESGWLYCYPSVCLSVPCLVLSADMTVSFIVREEYVLMRTV